MPLLWVLENLTLLKNAQVNLGYHFNFLAFIKNQQYCFYMTLSRILHWQLQFSATICIFKSGNANSVCWKTSLQKSSYTTLQSNGNAIKVLNLYVCLVLHFKRQFQAAKRKRRENTHLFFRSHIWAFAEGILKTLDVTCFPNSHRKWCCSNNISYQKDTNSGVGFSYAVKPCNHPTYMYSFLSHEARLQNHPKILNNLHISYFFY